MGKLNCKNCESENIRKISIIYEDGLGHINTKSSHSGIGLGFNSVGVGLGSSRTKGTQQTELSRKVTPPNKWSYFTIFKVHAVVLVTLWLVIESIIGATPVPHIITLASFVFFCYKAYLFNSYVYPKSYDEWNKKYMCDRCGAMTVI